MWADGGRRPGPARTAVASSGVSLFFGSASARRGHSLSRGMADGRPREVAGAALAWKFAHLLSLSGRMQEWQREETRSLSAVSLVGSFALTPRPDATMPALFHTPAVMRSARPTALPRGPAPPAADKMCRDVVSAPKEDRPAVEGVATVRFLGAGGVAIEVECAKV